MATTMRLNSDDGSGGFAGPSMDREDSRSQEVRGRIARRPVRPWQLGPTQRPGIELVLTTECDTTRIEALRALTADAPFLDLTSATRTTLRTVLGDDRRRVDALGAGIFGRDFVYLTHRDAGAVFLDTASRTYLQMEWDQVPGVDFSALNEATWRVVGERPPLGQPVTVEILITAPSRVRWVVVLDPRPDWAPFAGEAMMLVLGGVGRAGEAGLPIAALAALGFPVQGSAFLDDAATPGAAPLITFAVANPQVRAIADAEFAIPGGFADLRDATTRGDLRTARTMVAGPRSPRAANVTPTSERGATTAGAGANPAAAESRPGAVATPSVPPSCGVLSTLGSTLALQVQHTLADDLTTFANIALKRFTGLMGAGGTVHINWLDQLRQFSMAKKDKDGIYCLLRDEPSAPPGDPVGGKGWLDQLSVQRLTVLLRDNTLPAGLTLPVEVRQAITDLLKNVTLPPDQRYARLDKSSQLQLREAYTTQILGDLQFPYPDRTGALPVLSDLLYIDVKNIAFRVAVTPMAAASITGVTLGDNSIVIEGTLPAAVATADLTRWPGWRYLLLVAFGGSLVPLIAAIGVFLLLDDAAVSIRADGFQFTVEIQYVPNTDPKRNLPSGTLVPVATVTLKPVNLAVTLDSRIPDGIHMIVDNVLATVLSSAGDLLSMVEPSAADALSERLTDTLGLVFPQNLAPAQLSSFSAQASGRAPDHLSFAADFYGSGTGSYITQVDADVRDNLRRRCADYTPPPAAPGQDLYFGLALSQNYLNLHINSLWRQGVFTRDLGPVTTAAAVAAVKALGVDFVQQIRAHLWLPVTPRVVLTPRENVEHGRYLTTFFDDVRLCISGLRYGEEVPVFIEVAFAAEAYTVLGFGAPDDAGQPLNLLRIPQRFLDLYFDLDRAGVQLVPAEVQRLRGAGLDEKALPSLQTLLRQAMAEVLGSRNDGVVPRAPGDPPTVIRYAVAGGNIEALVSLAIEGGNVYALASASVKLAGRSAGIGTLLLVLDGLHCADAEVFRSMT